MKNKKNKPKNKNLMILNAVLIIALIVMIFVKHTPNNNDFKIKNLDYNTILNRSILGGDFLVKHQYNNGKFYYITSMEGVDISNNDYSLVRHFGAVYSLLRLYEVTKDNSYIQSAKNALKYSMTQINKNNDTAPAYYNSNNLMLGENGFGLMTLSYYYYLSDKDDAFIDETEGIVKHLLNIKDKIIDYKSKSKKWSTSQACLGLIFYNKYVNNNNQNVFETTTEIINYLIKMNTSDHWLPQAIYHYSNIFDIDKKTLKSYHKKIRGWAFIKTVQFYFTDIISFNKIKRSMFRSSQSCGLAANSEGLIAVYKIAKQSNDIVTSAFLKTGLKNSIYNLMQHQISKDGFIKKKNIRINFENTEGGWFDSFKNPTIRIDYNRHNICYFLDYNALFF